ncbi:flavohemoglobin expression-modulating QEGLA motif protein [soil metagenome]
MDEISEEFIKKVIKRLTKGKGVRLKLPRNGLLHIDRPLPFLLVYRYPPDRDDSFTHRLVRSEASYLIASGHHTTDLQRLVRAIADTLSDSFGACLIIELWAAKQVERTLPDAPAPPVFRLLAPAEVTFTSVTYLKDALEEMPLGQLPTTAEVLPCDRRQPKGLPPLLETSELKPLEGLLLGLEVQPFYLNPETGRPFPLVLRALISGLSKALKRTFFDFVRIQTTYQATHFQMLGRRLVTRTAWNIDRSLADINDAFKFLLLVTPINTEAAWVAFRESHFEKTPKFHYRLLPVDPEALKRKLYNIPIERVEDPTLAFLFRDKRHELDKMLSLLAEREKPSFLLGSQQLYGRLEEPLVHLAEGLLAGVPAAAEAPSAETMPPEEFARLARQEIDYFREQYPDIEAQVVVQEDIVGLIVSEGNLYVGTNAHIAVHRAEALIQHEVGTHVLTYYNGKAQPLRQLYCGVPGYEELQEGLAVLSEFLVGGLTPARLRTLAVRVVAVQALVQGASFIDTFRLLHEKHGFAAHDAFITTMRVYRGGGLTKDAIYLKGLARLLAYLQEGNQLEPLLIGKIRENYIPLMQELIYRKVLRPVPIRPRYLSDPAVQPKLEQLKAGISVLELIRK